MGDSVKGEDRWNGLNMPDLSESRQRDIRGEIEDALNNHEELEVDLKRMQPHDFQTPIDDLEHMDEDFSDALKPENLGEYAADTFLEKLEAALDRDDFSFLPELEDVPSDESGEGYW